MKFDTEIPTFMIRDSMKIFLEDIEGHIQDAEKFVKNDPEDTFHINMVRIFDAARQKFTLLFAGYLNSNEELGITKNKLLADKLIRFVEEYKAKRNQDIIFQLVGDMLESRISVIFEDE